ncbi:conjugal transfer protein MobA [Sphingobacterium bambusae]|uniref:Conjugal transfer protein MobA n=1 Tax=Sphingobacterium bambusae TaxID=662858 RepID=A0ABW6B8U2_9SPHI|nr:conjugal transfer protein MobA [Sphingobacterium bambusae]WPL49166.1 conjugal transfer protein MobA [Sphingobacterium bambusae]
MEINAKKMSTNKGRKLTDNPALHRYVFRLTDKENVKFLAMFEKSGAPNKANFIVSWLFSRELRMVKIDKGTVDFYMRLTSFYNQFRAIGVNYNQIVKILYTTFSEKKAAARLYKLEKQTAQLAALCQQIIALIDEFEKKYPLINRSDDR